MLNGKRTVTTEYLLQVTLGQSQDHKLCPQHSHSLVAKSVGADPRTSPTTSTAVALGIACLAIMPRTYRQPLCSWDVCGLHRHVLVVMLAMKSTFDYTGSDFHLFHKIERHLCTA